MRGDALLKAFHLVEERGKGGGREEERRMMGREEEGGEEGSGRKRIRR